MVAAWSPHGRRMVAAWSPHGQDGALYNFCSICYTSDKERNLARHPNNCQFFIWQTFLSLYCSINVVVCSPRRQDGALYNFCSICYNSGTERKREREKEKLSKSMRSLAGGKPPAPPVAGGNPHAHLNGTVAHAGLPAPSQGQAPRTPRPTAGASPCRHPCIPQRNCRTPQRNYATRWPAGTFAPLIPYMCTYSLL